MPRRQAQIVALVGLLLLSCAPAAKPAPSASGAPAATGAVTAAVDSAPAAPTEAPRALEKINFAIPQVNGVSMPYAIAVQQGFFREEGFDVEITAMRTNLVAAALASGEVDYISAFIPGVRNALTGLPMRVIAGTATGSTRRLMVVPGINSLDRLRGQTIAIGSFGDGPHSGAMLALALNGIDPETEITWLTGGTTVPDRLATLQQGLAQGSVFSASEIPQAEALGLQSLINLSEVAPMPESGVSTSLQKLATQREQVKRMLRGLVRGLQYTRNEREGSIPAFMERLRLSREDAEAAYDGVAQAFSPDGTVSERSLQFTIEAQKRQLKLSEEITPDRVADFGPLHEALAEMGITPAPGSAR